MDVHLLVGRVMYHIRVMQVSLSAFIRPCREVPWKWFAEMPRKKDAAYRDWVQLGTVSGFIAFNCQRKSLVAILGWMGWQISSQDREAVSLNLRQKMYGGVAQRLSDVQVCSSGAEL